MWRHYGCLCTEQGTPAFAAETTFFAILNFSTASNVRLTYLHQGMLGCACSQSSNFILLDTVKRLVLSIIYFLYSYILTDYL